MANFLSSFVTPKAWEKQRSPPQAISAQTDALFDECYRGRTVRIVQLIESGADVNAKDYHDKQAPLSIACGLGHYEVAKLLLEHGASVETENKGGATALFEACRGGYVELVKLLLSYGANPNRPNWTTGETILLASCAQKRWDVVQLLLERGIVQNVEETTDQGETVLHLIAHSLNRNNQNVQNRQLLQELILQFLKAGVDINETDSRGKTALHIACSHDEADDTIIQLLLQCGANVNAKREHGWTPLLQCSGLANFNSSRALLEYGAAINDATDDAWTPLLLFCSADHYRPEAIRELILRYHADVKAVRPNGKTALHYICEKGDHEDVETARLLIDHGADVNALTIDEAVSPLHVACFHNHFHVAKLLLERGAKASSKRSDDITPLHVVCAIGYVDLVQLLRNNGADVDARALYDLTPAYYACESGHLPTVRALLEHGNNGANVNARCNGQTLLYTAYHKVQTVETVGLVKLLLEMGAHVDAPITETHGTTLFQIACWNSGMAPAINKITSLRKRHSIAHQKGMPNFCSLFLEAGACLHKTNKHGWQALHFAAARGNSSTVEWLLKQQQQQQQQGSNNNNTDDTNSSMINAQTLRGSTPLHIACQMGRSGIVQTLLDRGASVALKNSKGKLPLEAALCGGNRSSIFLILQHMAGEGQLF